MNSSLRAARPRAAAVRLAAALAPLAAGCADPLHRLAAETVRAPAAKWRITADAELVGATVCAGPLETSIEPAVRTIRVGETLRPSFVLSACDRRWTPPVVWRAADTSVVRVDGIGGRVVGRAPGRTTVQPAERTSLGDLPYMPVPVTVVP